MLVKFEEEGKKNKSLPVVEVDIDELSKEAGRKEAEIVAEKYTPTDEELQTLEVVLQQMQNNQAAVEEEDPENPTKINRLTYTRS
jgi:hypothetical protein